MRFISRTLGFLCNVFKMGLVRVRLGGRGTFSRDNCGCGRGWKMGKFDVRYCLKISVRTIHGLLTAGVISSLIYYKTGLQAAITSGDILYCLSFFTTVIFSLTMYYISCLMDPGYVAIPTSIHNNNNVNSDEEDGPVHDEMSLMPDERVALRECGFCGCMQPLRARHCEDCDRCIRKFDHHCPWLDTCVGEGNHRFFLMFVISKAIATTWATIIIWQALEFHTGWSEWLKTNAILLLDLCITVTVTVILTILGGLHTYLMAINSTTWEMISRERISYLKNLEDDINPFHEGYFCNIYRFLFSKSHRSWEGIYKRNARSKDINI